MDTRLILSLIAETCRIVSYVDIDSTRRLYVGINIKTISHLRIYKAVSYLFIYLNELTLDQ